MYYIGLKGKANAGQMMPVPPAHCCSNEAIKILAGLSHAAVNEVHRLANPCGNHSAVGITNNCSRIVIVVRDTNKQFVTHVHLPQ